MPDFPNFSLYEGATIHTLKFIEGGDSNDLLALRSSLLLPHLGVGKPAHCVDDPLVVTVNIKITKSFSGCKLFLFIFSIRKSRPVEVSR